MNYCFHMAAKKITIYSSGIKLSFWEPLPSAIFCHVLCFGQLYLQCFMNHSAIVGSDNSFHLYAYNNLAAVFMYRKKVPLLFFLIVSSPIPKEKLLVSIVY